MPATIAGAVGILQTNVLVNRETGFGQLWEPIMALEVLNPIFNAIQYATISCIAVGIASEYTSATGLFTGMIVAIVGMEVYGLFRKMDAIKVKMPEGVPQGVARSFEVLVPTILTCIVFGLIALLSLIHI